MTLATRPNTPTPLTDDTTAGWLGRVGRRLKSHRLLKATGSTVFTSLFFWAYFSVLNNPRSTPVVVPEIWLDHLIELSPWAFPIYASLWVYVFLPSALLGNLRSLVAFGAWVGALCAVGLLIFWWFPTQTPEWMRDWGQYPGLSLIKGVDAAGNACPSLHVATAVFSACWMHRLLRQLQTPAYLRWISALHALAIIWSTMATLQHVAIDAMAGTLLGLVFAAASLKHVKNVS